MVLWASVTIHTILYLRHSIRPVRPRQGTFVPGIVSSFCIVSPDRRRDVFAPSSHGFDGKEPRRARPSAGVVVLRPGEPEAMDFRTMCWAHAPIPLTCSWSGVSIVFVNAAPYVLHAEVAELADALRSGRSGLRP